MEELRKFRNAHCVYRSITKWNGMHFRESGARQGLLSSLQAGSLKQGSASLLLLSGNQPASKSSFREAPANGQKPNTREIALESGELGTKFGGSELDGN